MQEICVKYIVILEMRGYENIRFSSYDDFGKWFVKNYKKVTILDITENY